MTLFCLGWDHKTAGCSWTRCPVLTIVQVLHCGVLGEARVKVGHQGSHVLRGGQHLVSDLPHEDEAWVTQTQDFGRVSQPQVEVKE